MKRHRFMFYTLVESCLTSLFGTCRSPEDTHNKELGDKRKGKHTRVYLGVKNNPQIERLQPTLHAKHIEDIPCVPLREPITAYLLHITSNVFIKTIQGLLNRQIFMLWTLAPGSDSLLKNWQRQTFTERPLQTKKLIRLLRRILLGEKEILHFVFCWGWWGRWDVLDFWGFGLFFSK